MQKLFGVGRTPSGPQWVQSPAQNEFDLLGHPKPKLCPIESTKKGTIFPPPGGKRGSSFKIQVCLAQTSPLAFHKSKSKQNVCIRWMFPQLFEFFPNPQMKLTPKLHIYPKLTTPYGSSNPSGGLTSKQVYSFPRSLRIKPTSQSFDKLA